MYLKKIRKKIKSTFIYDAFKNFFSESKTSYAETFGEDLFVESFFKNIKKGFYVDIGCNLPKNGSLTFKLYKRNWTGIKVDISERSIELNNLLRKKDINLNLSVGSKKDTVNAYIFYDNCTMNTVNKKFSLFTKKSVNKEPSIKKIKQLTLDEILKINKVKNIDYLNIDVEGYEEDVLAGFKIDMYRPELVSIEIHDRKCPPLENKIYKYFMRNKYSLVSIYGWTYFFSSNQKNNIHFNY